MGGQEIRDALGKNIKLFRFHNDFSQADLAEKAGISITFLSDIERGNKWPYPDTLSNLATALQVDVSELFKVKPIPNEMHEIMTRFSADLSRTVNQSLESVCSQYLQDK